jgi:acyl carrier protein phosphodiesterase
MNYLAHAYLSFNDPNILIGNMISDFVKGKKKFNYSLPIQQGIQLHRSIDAFTDNHPATAEAKKFFKPIVGLYAGAFVDIVYDHFLAVDANEKSEEEWQQFVTNTYQILFLHIDLLPEKFALILPYMRHQNWLFNYRFNTAIKNSFEGLVRRAKYLNTNSEIFDAFENNYEKLKLCYEYFFPSVKEFTLSQFHSHT